MEAGAKADSQLNLVLPASGLPPIPGHLVKMIKENKFIRLSDLLPEALHEMQFDKASDKKEDIKAKKKHAIVPLLDWMQNKVFANSYSTVRVVEAIAGVHASYVTTQGSYQWSTSQQGSLDPGNISLPLKPL